MKLTSFIHSVMVAIVRPNDGSGSDLVAVMTWKGTHIVSEALMRFSANTSHSVARLRAKHRRSMSDRSFFSSSSCL